MTEEKFVELKEIKTKIENTKHEIRIIDQLMTSCGLSCEITGTAAGTFRHKPVYRFSNKKEIIRILQTDKDILINELSKLERLFSEY